MYDAKNKMLTLNYKAQKNKTILKGKKKVYLHLYIKMKDKLIKSF